MVKKIKIAIDAMGGDDSPKKIIEGIKLHSKKSEDCFYRIIGDIDQIAKYIDTDINKDSYELIDTKEKIEGSDSALTAAKKGKNTSMWLAIESVKKLESDIVISAGNTGALFVIAKLNLKMIETIDKPALAGLWPNKNGSSIVLDLGASIDCSEKNLVDFSLMGSALHKALYPNEISNVAILNIGSEEIKGHEIIKKAYEILNSRNNLNYNFSGYIEGNELMDGKSNVIITDGFTGNVALKTAEGTANFITSELKKSMTSSFLGKLSSLLNIKNLRNFKKKFDPRLYNGAILLGLTSAVIKSHGATDSLGFSYSLSLCEKIVKGELIDKIKKNIN